MAERSEFARIGQYQHAEIRKNERNDLSRLLLHRQTGQTSIYRQSEVLKSQRVFQRVLRRRAGSILRIGI